MDMGRVRMRGHHVEGYRCGIREVRLFVQLRVKAKAPLACWGLLLVIFPEFPDTSHFRGLVKCAALLQLG